MSKKKRFKNIIVAGLLSMAVFCSLTACASAEDNAGISFLSGFGKNELFRIGSVSCSVPEYMVFLTNTQNQYEQVYGSEIWEVALGDVTLEENVKDTVLARIAQIKTMYLLAKDKGITLDEQQTETVQQAAAEYFNGLNDKEKEALAVTLEDIEDLYTEYAMADLVYQQIVDGVDPEISDDEARTITVDQILIKTYTIDSQGKRVEYSAAMDAAAYEKAQEALGMLADGSKSFADAAAKYNEDSKVRYSFRKGEVDAVFEEAAFELATEEISNIVRCADGYRIIKCISTFDREQTDANKLIIAQERKNEAFGEEYDAFVETLAKNINEKLWKNITLLQEKEITTANFFEIYEKYFSL